MTSRLNIRKSSWRLSRGSVSPTLELVLAYAVDMQVVEALASELSTACGEEGVAREDAQTADAVTFETVRDTLEAALEWEIQAADEVTRAGCKENEMHIQL